METTEDSKVSNSDDETTIETHSSKNESSLNAIFLLSSDQFVKIQKNSQIPSLETVSLSPLKYVLTN